jgi:hypothetical protein
MLVDHNRVPVALIDVTVGVERPLMAGRKGRKCRLCGDSYKAENTFVTLCSVCDAGEYPARVRSDHGGIDRRRHKLLATEDTT